MNETADLINICQGAALAGVSRSTVERWIRIGQLAAIKLPGRTGAYVIRRADFDAALAARSA